MKKSNAITPELVQGVHKAELQLIAFTINDRRGAEHFEHIGVDGIITNYLDVFEL